MSPYPKSRRSSISGSCSQVRGLWSGRLTRELVQQKRFCTHFTWSNVQSLFLSSPMYMKDRSWLKEWDCRYKRLRWVSSGGWLASPLRIRWEVQHLRGTWTRAAAPLHWREPVEVVQASGKNVSCSIPYGGVPGTSSWEEAQDRPRSRWRDYLCTDQGTPGISRSELAEEAKQRGVWGPLLKLLPSRHDPR